MTKIYQKNQNKMIYFILKIKIIYDILYINSELHLLITSVAFQKKRIVRCNMRKPLKMLAFDIGASNGRAILGLFEGTRLKVQEIHRFANEPVSVRGSLFWDILRLFHEIKQGIIKCAITDDTHINSIAVDTWGVDFGLLDKKGYLLVSPFHYRAALTDDIMEKVFEIIPEEELYNLTGIQLMKFNSVFQLYAMKYYDLPMLKEAKTFLMIPDLLNYFLTGACFSEYSVASTTQLLDPRKRKWSAALLERLDLPEDIYPEIVQPGTQIGNLSEELTHELRVGKIPIIATSSHDTASAVVSIPVTDYDYVYISCGTWSLMGIEEDEPIINDKSFKYSFTNEGGVGNKIRLLKMIMGLWLVQESKRQWEIEGKKLSFAELEVLANNAPPFKSFIDPDNDLFMHPGDMPDRIRQYCRNTNQPIPEGEGEVVRCIMQSLALKYRMTVESLEEITGKRFGKIHMVGGGIRDKMLCRFTADATGRTVLAGPVEATSVGNLMVQAMGLGEVKSLKEIRQVVKDSFPVESYEPEDTSMWKEAYEKFREIIKNYKEKK